MAQINTYSPDSMSRVCVQYDREKSVNLGLQQTEEKPALMPDGTQIVVDGKPVTNQIFDEFGGQWTALDRSGINNLIRSLREARDKAFGKDE